MQSLTILRIVLGACAKIVEKQISHFVTLIPYGEFVPIRPFWQIWHLSQRFHATMDYFMASVLNFSKQVLKFNGAASEQRIKCFQVLYA